MFNRTRIFGEMRPKNDDKFLIILDAAQQLSKLIAFAFHKISISRAQKVHDFYQNPFLGRIGKLLLPNFSQLPSVEKIVPNAVEPAGYGGERVEEGVGHPDGENGVLLSERLLGSNFTSGAHTDFPADEELQSTAKQRSEGYATSHGERHSHAHNAAGGERKG